LPQRKMAQREFTNEGGAGSIREGEEEEGREGGKDAVLGDRRAASLAGAGSFSRRVFGRRFAAEEDGRERIWRAKEVRAHDVLARSVRMWGKRRKEKTLPGDAARST